MEYKGVCESDLSWYAASPFDSLTLVGVLDLASCVLSGKVPLGVLGVSRHWRRPERFDTMFKARFGAGV